MKYRRYLLKLSPLICKKDYTPEQIKVWISSIENIKKWTEKIKKQHFLIALIESPIVGYASLERNEYLDLLYIHKDFQRHGIAGRLYHEIEKEAIKRGATALTSDVSITAKTFFEKKGFHVLFKQTNIVNGIELLNYKMVKKLYLI